MDNETSPHPKAADDYRRRRLFASIGGALTALANMGTTLSGAPSAPDAAGRAARLSDRARAIYDRETVRNLSELNKRADRALVRRRNEADIGLRRLRLEQQEAREARQDELRRQASDRADRITDSRVAEADSRIAERAGRAEKQAANSSRKPASPRRHASTFTWVNPDNGERFTVDRSTWDKSSYTMLQIVADATRPKPDSRGFPSVSEWRRHCVDTYSSPERRDSYIMRNLPSAPEALTYLRRIRRN